MPLQPVDWNVVVLGRWNRGILTPQGIVTRLFKQPEGTQFNVEVPVDSLGPFKVLYDDLVVIADYSRLIVEAPKNNYDNLGRAMSIAWRAMDCLPETPLQVAGYNIRYRGSGTDELASPLMIATQHDWDNLFMNAGYPISQRTISRTADWEGGRIQVSLARESGDTLSLAINFERGGDRASMMEWLKMEIDDIRAQVKTICSNVLHLKEEALA